MDLLKRRGASPLKIKIDVDLESPKKIKNIPVITVNNEHYIKKIISPNSADVVFSPIETTATSLINKLRKFSSVGNNDMQSPDLSPIFVPSNNQSSIIDWRNINSAVKQTFKKSWTSPLAALERRISSFTNLDYSNSDIGNSTRNRCVSENCIKSPNEQAFLKMSKSNSCEDYSDEVFEVIIDYPTENCVTYKKANKERKFDELLRQHSLDTCISLFKKHEIDLDIFLTLTRSDLHEIGVDWDKRDKILNVIDKIHNKM